MTLIEVNSDSKTAPQDRSCKAVGIYYDGTMWWGCKIVPFAAREKCFPIKVQVSA